MTVDQYQIRLSLLTYKLYKKVQAKTLPYSVYYHVWSLCVEENRRAKDLKTSH